MMAIRNALLSHLHMMATQQKARRTTKQQFLFLRHIYDMAFILFLFCAML